VICPTRHFESMLYSLPHVLTGCSYLGVLTGLSIFSKLLLLFEDDRTKDVSNTRQGDQL
jgi:hypothetical protein